VIEARAGLYRARTTTRLGRREGFTVAVGWQKGAVTVPPVRYGAPGSGGYPAPMMLGGQRLAPFAAVGATLIGTLALLFAWLWVGRDPQGGAIYPRFDLPKDLTPAAVRYVERFGFDRRCLTAAIISMAVKGALEIVETASTGLFGGSAYRLEPLGAENRGLSAGEFGAYRKLFPDDRRLTLKADRTNGARMDRARAELKSRLWDEHYGASFRRNGFYTAGGIALGVAAAVVLIGVAERGNPAAVIQWVVAALAAGVLIQTATALWSQFNDMRQGVGLAWRHLARLVPFVIFAVAASIQLSAVVKSGMLTALIEPPILAAGGAFGMVAVLFHLLMSAPNKAGRELLDEIEGFALYMRTAEEDLLDILNPPERTPELFERLLPYAVALGLTHQWAEKFTAFLAAAAATAPVLYAGSRRFDIDRFDRDFGSAVSSTTVPSRGSSGSGGGGSSGGGGGGGGSGW